MPLTSALSSFGKGNMSKGNRNCVLFPGGEMKYTKILIKFFVYRLGLQENKIKSKAVKNMFCKEALCQYNGQIFNGLEANFLRLKHIY